jgi:outer membrane murein-binding lipoprotein Lpp
MTLNQGERSAERSPFSSKKRMSAFDVKDLEQRVAELEDQLEACAELREAARDGDVGRF